MLTSLNFAPLYSRMRRCTRQYGLHGNWISSSMAKSISFRPLDEPGHFVFPLEEPAQSFFEIGSKLARPVTFAVQAQTPHRPGERILLNGELALNLAAGFVDGTLAGEFAESIAAASDQIQEIGA